jgi:CubicO group peptidase (beta-lactamase class C family)
MMNVHNPHAPLSIAALLLSLTGCAVAPDQPLHAGLRPDMAQRLEAVQRALIDDEVTGSNILLVSQRGQEIYRRVVNADRRGDRDITPDTLFPIWSMSKPITIVAMMTLFEQGKFSFDDPVSKYIPCFAELQVAHASGPRPATQPLLVEHLMTHRSGYGYYALGGDSTDMPTPPAFDRPSPNQTRFDDLQSFCEAAARQPLAFEPGTAFLYGINQAILGRLVEVLSGVPFAEYLKTTIFDPLGMSETSFVLDDARRARLQPLWINMEDSPALPGLRSPGGTVKGYTNLLNELTYSPRSRAHFGGEGLVSSPADYARFCQMLLGGGVYDGRRILTEDSIARMTTPASRNIFDGPGTDMGYSVFVLREGHEEGSLAPAGVYGWSGYHNTHFWIDPEHDLFVVFMSRAREFRGEIPIQLRAALYGEGPSAE